MASLKKKSNFEREILEVVNEEVNEVVEEVTPNITEDEKTAIKSAQEKEENSGASTKKLKKATAIVSSKFNLDDTYKVTNFKDSGKVVNLTLENKDFTVTIQIKDSERHGLSFED